MVALSAILAHITGVPHTFGGPYSVCAEPGGEPYIAKWDDAVLGEMPSEEQIASIGATLDIKLRADSIRKERNVLISETDYLLMSDYSLTEEKKASVLAYRQALRDITLQATFPQNVTWPVLE